MRMSDNYVNTERRTEPSFHKFIRCYVIRLLFRILAWPDALLSIKHRILYKSIHHTPISSLQPKPSQYQVSFPLSILILPIVNNEMSQPCQTPASAFQNASSNNTNLTNPASQPTSESAECQASKQPTQ